MDLEYLAKRIIKLEQKLYDPNEESYIVECKNLDKAADILSKIGYVSLYTPQKLFFQAYIPDDNSISSLDVVFFHNNMNHVEISHLGKRARCFDEDLARAYFQEYFARPFCGATYKDFKAAKKIAAKLEEEQGIPYLSARFMPVKLEKKKSNEVSR